MSNLLKRSLALIIVLICCISTLPTVSFNASAATVDYVYSGNYIYNWGTRGTVATFLSPNAEEFYDDHVSYTVLSSYSGGTGTSDAPNSALYDALQDLMKGAHSYTTSYNATKNLFQYTDCQNGGGKISSFYSGNQIGPSWNGGWNREHTWPNSKGLGGSDEDDIMMLRPTSTSENSSRGNTAYGKSSGYYNPNSESNGQYDLRGDVARIFLYVYVRWGNVNGNGSYSTWGSRGVMESLDVLLEWMEADPVDTWELGRNDSVESITGTRNVFVDYPELAFMLFGRNIPAGMATPSSEGSNQCDHNYDSGTVVKATCTTSGYTLYTCKVSGCGYSYKSNVTQAKGHSYVSGTCSACGEKEPVKPTYVTSVVPGKAYKLGFYSTSARTEYYFIGTMSGYYGSTDTDYSNGVDVYVENTSGGYYLYFKNSSGTKQYINLVLANGSDGRQHYNFTFGTTASSVYTWDSARNALTTKVSGGACYIGTFGTYYTMSVIYPDRMQDTDYFARMYTYAGDSSAPETTTGGVTTDRPQTTTPSVSETTGRPQTTTPSASVTAGGSQTTDPSASGTAGESQTTDPSVSGTAGGAQTTAPDDETLSGDTTGVDGTTVEDETVDGTTDETQTTIPDVTDPSDTTDGENDKGGKKKNDNGVIIAVISVVAIVTMGTVATILIIKEKKSK